MVEFIVAAAIRILETEGAAAVTTTAVARVAGISVGSLYQYFPNGEAILAAVVADKLAEIRKAILGAEIPEDASLEGAVRATIDGLLALKRQRVRVSVALVPLVGTLESRAMSVAASRALAADLLEKLAPHFGRAPTEADRIRIRLAVAAVEGALAEIWSNDPEAVADPALPAVLTGMFLGALAPADG